MARSGQYTHGGGPQFSDMTIGDYANGMPSIRLGEMFKSMLRQLTWVLPLTIIGSILLFFATNSIKRTYEADGRILVQLGSEYVYEDVTGSGQNQGLMLTPDIITLNETALMKNTEVLEQVIGEMHGRYPDQFAPEAFAKIEQAKATGDKQIFDDARVELHEKVDRAFTVSPQPKSSIIDVSYKHEDGDIAVETVNAFIRAYLSYRRTLFVEGTGDVIAEQRSATETTLNTLESKIQSFLNRNGISDFESERIGASERTEQLRAELNTLRASIAETEAALASVENQMRQTPQQIDVYIDDRASQRVAQAELEMKQLLAKYLPTSDPVRAKQLEIDELKSLQRANGGNPVGGRRVGPNNVYQELLSRRNTLQSSADSFREREFTVQQQLNAADAKVRKLQRLSPSYNNLLRERSTLDQRLRGYNNKEQEAIINQQQAQAESENVRVIFASLPRKGRNMAKILWALSTLAWFFTLAMIALLKVFLDPSLYITPTRRVSQPVQSYGPSPVPGYGYDAHPGTYVPEPVPAAAPYAAPYVPAQAAPVSAYAPTAYDGSAAHDIYAQPQPQAYQAPPEPAEAAVPIIGTVPSTDRD